MAQPNWLKLQELLKNPPPPAASNKKSENEIRKLKRRAARRKEKRQLAETAAKEDTKTTLEQSLHEEVVVTDAQRGTKRSILAIDCEMVGVGSKGKESILARVSLVDIIGNCVYDHYVTPMERVTNYRTSVSGITPIQLRDRGRPFKEVQPEVAALLDGSILVGHSLKHDLEVLMINHPRHKIRDTATYKPFRAVTNGRTPSLRILAETILQQTIQTGEHDSVEDARAAMTLYTRHKKDWERLLAARRKERRNRRLQQPPI